MTAADYPYVGHGLPPCAADLRDEAWMRRALDVAAATPQGDVPVGAVIVDQSGAVIATGTNRREADSDPLGHAEVAAIRQASVALGRWRLDSCTLVVTLEPCAMCAGAIVGSRMQRVVFGAYEPNTGAGGSVWDVLRDSPLHPVPTRGGVLAAECETMLRDFFHGLRRR